MLDENIMLIKFGLLRDRNCVLARALWFFEKHLLLFQEYDGNLRSLDYLFIEVGF